jgi:hypothetical protein
LFFIHDDAAGFKLTAKTTRLASPQQSPPQLQKTGRIEFSKLSLLAFWLMGVYSRSVGVQLVRENHDQARLPLNYPLGGSALQLCQTVCTSRD